jgi:putative transposase
LHQHILQDLILTLPEMAEQMSVSISEINGEEDHIHFLLETTPQDNLGSVIGALKARSSSYLHNKYVFPYWGKHSRTLWSSGYFVVSTGGAPLDVIKKYIQNQ